MVRVKTCPLRIGQGRVPARRMEPQGCGGMVAAPRTHRPIRKTPGTRIRVAWLLMPALCAPCVTGAQEATAPLAPEALSARYPEWTALAPGLELRVLKASRPSRVGDELIVVARIDPRYHEFALAVSAARDKQRRTARDWAQRERFVAAINAGMFRAAGDGLPVGFTRAGGVTLNPGLTADRGAFAFSATHAPRLLDRDCDPLGMPALNRYTDVLQGIRMISCNGRNVWAEQPKEWSMAAIATDAAGRVLFIHVRSPYSVHTFTQMLMASPLGVKRAMYLEGGPEATLFVHVGDVVVERIGSYETGFHENNDNVIAWPLPNVIGVRPGAAVPAHGKIDTGSR
jgi:hypothetical protein